MTLAIALAHARQGRAVFPCDGKQPRVKWQTAATTDEGMIRQWWKAWPDATVGWRIEEGLTIVDIDDEEKAASLDLPPAPEQHTPRGGRHLLYKGEAGQTVKKWPGIDTRVGDKGYVILYDKDAFSGSVDAIPAWLTKPQRNEAEEWSPTGDDSILSAAKREGQLWLPDGTRDSGLTSIAGSIARAWSRSPQDGLRTALEALMLSGAVEQPPGREVTDRDLRRIAGSVVKHETRASRPERIGAFGFMDEVTPEKLPPLVCDALEPVSYTILFGDGGTGKGVLAAWWAAKMTRDGWTVLLLDWEGHIRYEWAPRLKAFGADLTRVAFYQPIGAVWDEVDNIKRVRAAMEERFGEVPIYTFVDSLTTACSGMKVEDSDCPPRFYAAMDDAGCDPACGLGHTTKVDPAAQYPFGSVHWHNLSRRTFNLVGKGPTTRTMFNRKSNGRPEVEPVTFSWSWSAVIDNYPRTLETVQTLDQFNALLMQVPVKEEGVEGWSADQIGALFGMTGDNFRKLWNGTGAEKYHGALLGLKVDGRGTLRFWRKVGAKATKRVEESEE